MDHPQHSIVALLVSLVGLLLELVGGFLLAREDLFKVRDSKRLRQELKVVTHPAMKDIPWSDYGVVLTSATDVEQSVIEQKLKEIPLKYNQKLARCGFVLLFAGIVIHGIERCLAYADVPGF
ncbi:MAG: hypothetical protein JO033_11385 [Acidobacteriaceae bacterium]|nr:hypothetical protein [Acidobacteriaceae bacterium]MBV9500372.1 hypothetical protein [Acidobacteriaceae bacterium]